MAAAKNLALLLGGVAVSAASLAPATAQGVEPVADINNGAISFSLGTDIVSKYIFRGYEIQEDGLILQPYAELVASLAPGLDIYLGTWNSASTSTNGTNNQHWFETDYYFGVSAGEDLHGLPGFAFDLSYVNYLSPNDTFGQYEELDFTVAYDDSANDIAFSPYALVAVEFDTQGAGDDDNIYAELGGSLDFDVIESDTYPVSVSIPVALGLSLDEFYVDDGGDNELFGFLSVGASAGVPLSFIPSEYGTWSAAAGLTFFLLNDNASGLDDGENDNYNIVGSVGIALEY